MSVECFLDTNILVYAISALEEDSAKKARALDLIETADFGISLQVMQEFYVTVTRKIAKPLAPTTALALLEEYRLFPVAYTDYPMMLTAIEYSLRYGISYWDAAIVAAAETLEAPLLFSEDLSHGQRYGSVTVENPFLGDRTQE